MEINKILKELFNFRNNKNRENIDDLIEIHKFIGSPCVNNVKIIHLAGTNGKGSTATFIENILFESGYNVGKFTSPHILNFNERIVYNKKMILDDEIIKFYNFILKKITDFNYKTNKNIALNFFEITFLMSLLFFEEKKIDFLILETGLGGRLDATNILNSEIAIITNVSFDHINILGNTLDEIAMEKAGIIKNNQLCLYSSSLPQLEKEILKKTNKYVNVLKKYNHTIILDKENLFTKIKIDKFEFTLPLFGEFQGHNFLLAYEVAKIYNISNEIIQRGLNNVVWKGRFEIFCNNPKTILDVAHNEDSIEKLCDNLKKLYNKNEVIIITSILETKDFKVIVNKLLEMTNKIFITSLKDIMYGLNSNEIKNELISLGVDTKKIIFQDSIVKAYETAKKLLMENTKYKGIVICGSFYEISKFIEKHNNL